MKLVHSVCDSAEKHFNTTSEGELLNASINKNEDAIYFGGYYAVVFDGATGLKNKLNEPGLTDAEWFVGEFLEQLKRHISPTVPLNQLFEEIIRVVKLKYYSKIESKFVNPAFQPSACVSLIRESKTAVEIFALGDAPILIKQKGWPVKEISDDALEQYQQAFFEKIIELKNRKGVSVKNAASVLKSFSQEFRSKKNTEEGYWILSLDQHAIKHASHYSFPKDEIEAICLLSDGFAQCYNSYGIYETPDEFLVALHEQGPASILDQIREIERNDLDHNEFPRVKQFDDASLLYIKI